MFGPVKTRSLKKVPGKFTHGTAYGYQQRNCGCEECTQWMRNDHAKRKQRDIASGKKKPKIKTAGYVAQGDVKHGIGNTYHLHMCRCLECKDWKRKDSNDYYHRIVVGKHTPKKIHKKFNKAKDLADAFGHGVHKGYASGCRCHACRAWKATDSHSYYERRIGRPARVYGEKGTKYGPKPVTAPLEPDIAELPLPHMNFIRAICYQRLINKSMLDDVAQRVYVATALRMRNYRPLELRPFMVGVAKNEVRRVNKSEDGNDHFFVRDEEMMFMADAAVSTKAFEQAVYTEEECPIDGAEILDALNSQKFVQLVRSFMVALIKIGTAQGKNAEDLCKALLKLQEPLLEFDQGRIVMGEGDLTALAGALSLPPDYLRERFQDFVRRTTIW